MNTQNLIKRTLSQPEKVSAVRELLECNEFVYRTKLAKAVCKKFGFYDARGKEQVGGCLKALRELECDGHFDLPAGRGSKGNNGPRRLGKPVAEAKQVPEEVSKVKGLELLLVDSKEDREIWNEMMSAEHPRGAGPLVGAQLRYLIRSEHGWLGGVGFGAAALHLEARDKWIGWNGEQRRKYLHGVIGMSRFLIRRCVQCRNLASKVLSMAMSQLPEDFQQRYNYRPLLVESFVDTKKYSGACYRAANWILVGRTKGRGRQDRFTKAALSKKAIYVYPIERDFRKQMGLPAEAGLGALEVVSGLESESWAENEFGGAPLGDRRLADRLVKVAKLKGNQPGRAFSGVSEADWPMVKAYYRMIDQPDESAVSMDNILLPHRERTVRRMQGQKTVLCVQDGSDLNYNGLSQCKGLGEIGSNQTKATSRGLHLHSTFAVANNGLPLGVLKAECIAPKGKSQEQQRKSIEIPIEEKKTFTWIEHHRDLVQQSAKMPDTRLVEVCDREADFFEMFDEQRKNPRVQLLVRANYNRTITGESVKLFQAVGQTAVQSLIHVRIPRQSARRKKSKQKARAKRPARTASIEVRYKQIEMNPPNYHADKEPITLRVIHAVEKKPPPHTKRVEWFLLTTMPINCAKDAEECLRWYCLRWRIEDWHRVLKSGCRIESIAHKTAERLRRSIAINLVMGWRIMLMALLGRETPELPAEVLFSDIELRTLEAYAKKNDCPHLNFSAKR